MSPRVRIILLDCCLDDRHEVKEALEFSAEWGVVGETADADDAVRLCHELNPDLLLLGGCVDGSSVMEALQRLRADHALLPILVVSPAGGGSAATALEALANGASGCVSRPPRLLNPEADLKSLRACISPKVERLTGRIRRKTAAPPRAATPARGAGVVIPQAVGIASSTGGPKVLETLVTTLPANFSVPILLVQHMPPRFTTYLADRLNSISPLEVIEGEPGLVPRAGQIIIAPGGYHMVLDSTLTVRLTKDARENACRPSADPLFRSLSAAYGAQLLGVVLTGMGRDGLAGCRAIKQRGGYVMIQDEETSTVWGMPGSVAKANLADREAAAHDIPRALRETIRLGWRADGTQAQS